MISFKNTCLSHTIEYSRDIFSLFDNQLAEKVNISTILSTDVDNWYIASINLQF